MTPYEIAFGATSMGHVNTGPGFEDTMDIIFDIIFLIDVILTFKVAIVTEDYLVIDDKKTIANLYLKGWFTIDVISCIPFGEVGKIFLTKKESTKIQLIKLIKLLRISKFIKEKKKIFKYMDIYIGIEQYALQRLAYFFLIFILLSHIIGTSILILARIVNQDYIGTWRHPFRN